MTDVVEQSVSISMVRPFDCIVAFAMGYLRLMVSLTFTIVIIT
jgi:hypothetical protein